MSKKRSHLRLLLLQIRSDVRVCREEQESFANYSGLSQTQVDVLNVFDTPKFLPNIIEKYDGLFIGGSSKASVLEPMKFPFLKCGENLIHYCLKNEIPVFASCFGFQMAVIALGGEIIRDIKSYELGTLSIRLTEAAKDDPLFHDTSDGFLAICGHQEKALKLPRGCELLAFTDVCCHAFRVSRKPFWGFQFHPELNRQKLVERLTVYREIYTNSDEHFQRAVASFSDTPESNVLLKKFVDRVLLKLP